MASTDQSRWKFGLRAVLGGAIAIVAVTALAIFTYSDAAAVGTAIGPAVAAIGALTGAYFGIQAGSAGREEADAARSEAMSQALRFAAVADPDRALAVIGLSSPAEEALNLDLGHVPGPRSAEEGVGGLRGIGL
jgi:phage tail tape-measure protein